MKKSIAIEYECDVLNTESYLGSTIEHKLQHPIKEQRFDGGEHRNGYIELMAKMKVVFS
jgi:hypothetical protein